MSGDTVVTVRIRHGGNEVEFSGDKEEVWALVNRYFSERLGPVEAVAKLSGQVDLGKLLEKMIGKVVVNNGGIDVVAEADTKKRIVYCLAGAYAGRRLGFLDSDGLSPKRVAQILHIDEKVARARLSELWKEGVVDRDDEGRYFFKPSTGMKAIEGE
ncbi:hypothetical protein CSUB_C1522 [Candidatus Caldarchaeum subterraneum]|uniref:Uncharacterized protein n=1 Tax=Caldiarchaeum subterraneum TaxID=311458 RepID=E6N8P9_CALS0|nr:hypothetical protein HGMM_F12C01C42 [Candidatus Caldarchaeum subterraneum]BAJ51373.1 hypothetical protein CSUB_C1522 [Candidatus Caldarchaeum subterraneum]